MSQYLSHIANLALNRVPVVQPRLASRFEASAEFAPVVEDNQQRVAEAPSHHQSTQPEPPRPATANHPQAEPTAAPVAAQKSQAPALDVPAVHQHIQPTAEAAPTPVATEPQILVQQLVREPIHAPTLLVPTPVPQRFVITELGHPVIERQIERSLLIEHRSESSAPITADTNHGSSKAESKRDAVPVTSKAPHIQTRMAVSEPVSQTIAQRPSLQADLTTPAPSIQVSIGRIEIRANPASTSQAPKPSSNPATLSLDDYLKQRKGDR